MSNPVSFVGVDLNAWLLGSPTNPLQARAAMKCRDGFTVSIQVGAHHYCEPRSDHGPWQSVEMGFPSRLEPLLMDYAEDKGRWTETVYGWVPIELAAAVVELHGGPVKTPER